MVEKTNAFLNDSIEPSVLNKISTSPSSLTKAHQMSTTQGELFSSEKNIDLSTETLPSVEINTLKDTQTTSSQPRCFNVPIAQGVKRSLFIVNEYV